MTDTYNSTFIKEWVSAIFDHQSGPEYISITIKKFGTKLDISGTSAKHLDCLSLLSSFSFVVMLKDDSELEYPQCEIRARLHRYPIPRHFCECLSLCTVRGITEFL